ncbi:MAG: hypothetical protein A2271_03865 [Candidatus Moranbacteria bacterium RIFOXYA12_FULL_35_19]|nr:MAG: hypothetical protein UR78_C0003G0044 [Candidatus Moranbacteria bacterium GW2011_GWF2_35_39]OGI32104.1 MAG: hypothetical protein A2343_02265 [Candidatus Moranbacteria bacterium RIFOXYB12_FULL_35_8]OGI33341.1 MAG: hypothetical protein A2489_03750 [Candidatus Moranbacteria bacterium RIFOXYC12_FULL_36_13]OGI36309.1 MAG: hypothetical protein A2271_03865 [Candidatus Moranbacteria bacterium RIFOXYA12_FULL_35_19]
MLKINYLDIIKKAWAITWKNRYLWWFGFFVALGGGGSANYFFNSDDEKKLNPAQNEKILEFFSQNMSWIITFIIIAFLLLIIFSILNIIGRGALITSIEKNSQGQIANFKSGWNSGKKNFWKIFYINIFLSLFIFFTLIVLVAPLAVLFLNKNYIIGGVLSFLAVIIFIPLVILVSYLRIYSYLYAVLGKLNFWPALENAYKLFAKNIWPSIILSLIFIPLSFVFMLVIFTVLLILFFIFLLLSGIVFWLFGKITAIIIGAIGITIFLLILLFLQSIYAVFSQSIWILFFHEIATPKIPEEIVATETTTEPLQKPMPVIEVRKEN